VQLLSRPLLPSCLRPAALRVTVQKGQGRGRQHVAVQLRTQPLSTESSSASPRAMHSQVACRDSWLLSRVVRTGMRSASLRGLTASLQQCSSRCKPARATWSQVRASDMMGKSGCECAKVLLEYIMHHMLNRTETLCFPSLAVTTVGVAQECQHVADLQAWRGVALQCKPRTMPSPQVGKQQQASASVWATTAIWRRSKASSLRSAQIPLRFRSCVLLLKKHMR
jgi:hypothetical protein